MKNLTYRQTMVENKASMNQIDQFIAVSVNSTDLTPLVDGFNKYVADISVIDSKFTEHHIALLTANSAEKSVTVALKALIKADITKSAYVDRNVVANTIGKKLLPKKAKAKSAYDRASVALSLGLNIINACASLNLVHYKMITTTEKHNVSTLIVNTNLVEQHIRDWHTKYTRASNFMLIKPIDHTTFTPGGYLTTPRTMLNSSGFSSIKTQDDNTNLAINMLQDTAYAVRANLDTKWIEQYRTSDKWFNDRGQFMTAEWTKFVEDLRLASSADEIYFPMAYDDRGRMYETSAYVKYQGDKYQKSMLEFANKETCTEEGLEMLIVNLVNEIHSDKINFDEALVWFESQSDETIMELASNSPISDAMYMDYISAKAGNAVGTITHWDATNSGLQFYSLLGGDKLAASLCNVYNTGTIADAYKALADALNTATGTETFNRSNVKNAFMTYLYGSMAKNTLYKISDPKNGVTAGIAEFFPADWSEDKMWNTFEGSMLTIAPAAVKLMNLIYSYNVDQTKFCWTMPDGFRVETTSTSTETVKGYFIDHSGKTHEGTCEVKLEEYNKFSRALAPNIIHSVDAYFGREVIKRCYFDVSFIHDSFGCHPNHALELQQIVREVAAMILESDLLIDILTQISPEQTAYNVRKGKLSKGDLSVDDVLSSEYIVR